MFSTPEKFQKIIFFSGINFFFFSLSPSFFLPVVVYYCCFNSKCFLPMKTLNKMGLSSEIHTNQPNQSTIPPVNQSFIRPTNHQPSNQPTKYIANHPSSHPSTSQSTVQSIVQPILIQQPNLPANKLNKNQAIIQQTRAKMQINPSTS